MNRDGWMNFRYLVPLLALIGCATSGGDAARSAATPSPEVQVVHAFIAAFNAHDADALIAVTHPDIEWLNVKGDTVTVQTRGQEALRKAMSEYFAQIPSARSELEAVFATGPFVSVRERASWEGKKGPRSGRAAGVYEIVDGRIRRAWYFPAVP